MTDEILTDLLSGNDEHVESLPGDYFDGVIEGQQPSVVSICCSDSRVSQEGMWNVDRPGEVFTPSNIGNQVWDADAGEKIVDGSVCYPIHHCGTDAVAVVGHTGCGAVTAAYEVARGADAPRPLGVAKWIELLAPVIREALADDAVDADADGAPRGVDEDLLIDQLVEYNVDAQVEFLLEAPEIPDDVAVYGFVYDFEGAYGDDRGRAYLVNADGATEPSAIADRVPERHHAAVNSLLY
ncbi:carbonic anhydrase [Halovivax sp.]|uniref:carbonic anhydrase n=1 Tax=Halovivax sp. TaxID=1935978 RepID=UPI0025B805F9|nr:carbonic anhydrase [Halovivax sp.]